MVKEFEHLTADPSHVHTFKILQKKHSSVFTPRVCDPLGSTVLLSRAKVKGVISDTLGSELQPPYHAI